MCLPNGDSALVSLHGAHVLSWVSSGRERLYLSPRSVFDGQAAIRGGIPVCFPQFNQRGPLPKHGFARNLGWRPAPASKEGDRQSSVCLELTDSETTRAWWPVRFAAQLGYDGYPEGSLGELWMATSGRVLVEGDLLDPATLAWLAVPPLTSPDGVPLTTYVGGDASILLWGGAVPGSAGGWLLLLPPS